MRQRLLLVLVLAFCGVGVAYLTLSLPASTSQIVHRIRRSWQFDTLPDTDILEIDGEPETIDWRTLALDRIRIVDPFTTQRWADWRTLVQLDVVEWRRPSVLPGEPDVDLAGTEVHFRQGELRLSRSGSGAWNSERLAEAIGAEGMRRLPGVVRGDRLQLLATDDPASTALSVVLIRPRLERDGDRARVTAGLEGECWREGSLEWRFGQDPSLTIRVDDANLAEFPFVALDDLFGIHLPMDLGGASGRFDFDLRDVDGERVVTIQHYQAALPLNGWHGDLSYLTGRAEVRGESVDWQIDRAYYSQSQVHGALALDAFGNRISGELVIADAANDRNLIADVDGLMGRMLTALNLRGQGDVTLEFAGPLRASPAEQLHAVVASLRDLSLVARLDESAGTGVHGRARFAFGETVTDVEVDVTIDGQTWLRLPTSKWRGTLASDELTLSMVVADGDGAEPGEAYAPRCKLSIRSLPDDAIGFEITAADLPLGHLGGVDLDGGILRTLSARGRWSRATGWRWETRLTWSGVRLPETVRWPVTEIRGTLSGELTLTREHGQLRIAHASCCDDYYRWQGSGDLTSHGQVRFSGQAFDDRSGFFRADTFQFPVPGAEHFRVDGSIFDWTVDGVGGH